MFSLSITLALLSSFVAAQQATFPATPLASKSFAYPTGIPYKVDTDTNLIRGPQVGYNQCNSTTEGPNSLCQTSFFNGIDDFCLWAPPAPNSTVADLEGEMVAWCTKAGRGTRIIPQGALTGLQVIRTPDYIMANGFLDQTLINMAAGDFGGEMDPHGADLRGNPMGGIMYSTAFSPNNSTFVQVHEWTNFMGGGGFCLKACDPAGPNAAQWCQHIYDRIGCKYNAPNNAQPGIFESCQGENGNFPGVYTTNGAVVTYTQPAESLGPITTVPYEPVVPASSNCVTHASSELFANLPAPTTTAASTSPTASVAVPTAGSGTSSPSRSAPAAGASTTAASNDASTIMVSGVSILGGVVAALFLY